MTVTRFMDMHSGGGQKLDWSYILIEAPEDEARAVFWNRFKRNPDRVTCTCCGNDYSISEEETIEQATAFDRGCDWDDETESYAERQSERRSWQNYISVDEYLAKPEILFIRADEIKPEERKADIPTEGYVWA